MIIVCHIHDRNGLTHGPGQHRLLDFHHRSSAAARTLAPTLAPMSMPVWYLPRRRSCIARSRFLVGSCHSLLQAR